MSRRTWSWPATTNQRGPLAAPFALWVRGIRSGNGAIPYPTPEYAADQV
ncbi:hypothetical protein [Plantactinospora sp. ZYX-F-223]